MLFFYNRRGFVSTGVSSGPRSKESVRLPTKPHVVLKRLAG